MKKLFELSGRTATISPSSCREEKINQPQTCMVVERERVSDLSSFYFV